MLETKSVEIDGKTFILSKFPASAGRDIVCQYTLSAVPKLGDYAINRKMADKILSFVGVTLDTGSVITLSTEALIDNHCGSWETRMKVEMAMMEYNCKAFQEGRVSNFFVELARILNAKISSTLTDSLEQLYQRIKQPSSN